MSSNSTTINHRGRRLSIDGPVLSSLAPSTESIQTKLPSRSSSKPQPTVASSNRGAGNLKGTTIGPSVLSPLSYDSIYGHSNLTFANSFEVGKVPTASSARNVGSSAQPGVSTQGPIKPSTSLPNQNTLIPKRPLTVGSSGPLPLSGRGQAFAQGQSTSNGPLVPKRPLTQQLSARTAYTIAAGHNDFRPQPIDLPPLTTTPKRASISQQGPTLVRSNTSAYVPSTASTAPPEASGTNELLGNEIPAPIQGLVTKDSDDHRPQSHNTKPPLVKDNRTKSEASKKLAVKSPELTKQSPVATAAALVAYQDQHYVTPITLTSSRRGSVSAEESVSKGGDNLYSKVREAKIKHNASAIIGDLVSIVNKEYYNKRVAAAITIQCAWRSACARLECFSRRQIFLHYVHIRQKAAVTCLVSFFKGILLKRRRQYIVKRQTQKVQDKIVLERRQRAAVLKIIGAIRRYLARKKETQRLMRLLRIKQEEKLSYCRAAAVIVQRWFRLVRIERAYWRRRHAEIAAQEAQRIEARRIDTAATKIQKLFRGGEGRKYAIDYRARKERERLLMLRRIKESIDVVRVFLKTFVIRKRREAATGERLVLSADGSKVTAVPLELINKRHSLLPFHSTHNEEEVPVNNAKLSIADAAVRLIEKQDEQRKLDHELTQRMVREAQRIVYQRAMEAAKSCRTIQCCWRRYKARRDLKVKRRIAKTHDQIRIEKEFILFQSVCLVQRFANAAASSLVCERVRQYNTTTFWSGLLQLQRVGASYLSRRQLRQQQLIAEDMALAVVRAAEMIYNRNLEVLVAYVLAKESERRVLDLAAKKAQRDVLLMQEVRAEVLRDQSASRIQRVVRSFLARRATKKRVAELHAAKSRIITAVTTIQGFGRIVMAKNVLLKLRAREDYKRRLRALEVQRAEDMFLSFLSSAEELEAEARRRIIEREERRWTILVTDDTDGDAVGGSDRDREDIEDENDDPSNPYDV